MNFLFEGDLRILTVFCIFGIGVMVGQLSCGLMIWSLRK